MSIGSSSRGYSLLLAPLVDLVTVVAHVFDDDAILGGHREFGAIRETPDEVADARARGGVGRPDLGDELIVSGLVGDEPEVLDTRRAYRVVGHRELDIRRIARMLLRAGRTGFMRDKHQRERQQYFHLVTPR